MVQGYTWLSLTGKISPFANPANLNCDSMDDALAISQLRQINQSANEIAVKVDVHVPDFKKIMERVNEAERAWSGSYLGYQSCVYYEDLQPVPPGAYFDPEWGFDRFSKSLGNCEEFDYEGLIKHITGVVPPDTYESFKRTRDLGIENFNRLKDDLLSVLNLLGDGDEYLSARKLKISKLVNRSAQEIGTSNFPGLKMICYDRRAANGRLRLPPHKAISVELTSFAYPFEAMKTLAETADQILKHLERKFGVEMTAKKVGRHIFIGHGRSLVWRDLKDFIKDKLNLRYDEFNRVPIAGITNIDRLKDLKRV